MNILIVEDEVRLADALGQIMEEQHYHTDIVYTGTDGLYCGLSGEYDVIVLDVMLPGENGFDVVKKLRKAHVQTPVLMRRHKRQGDRFGPRRRRLYDEAVYPGRAAGTDTRPLPQTGRGCRGGTSFWRSDPESFNQRSGARQKVHPSGI